MVCLGFEPMMVVAGQSTDQCWPLTEHQIFAKLQLSNSDLIICVL